MFSGDYSVGGYKVHKCVQNCSIHTLTRQMLMRQKKYFICDKNSNYPFARQINRTNLTGAAALLIHNQQ